MSKERLRGIFPEHEASAWADAMSAFPNGVPRFKSKSECDEFTKRYIDTASNPDEPQMRQSITTLTTWDQIEKYLLPRIREYRSKETVLPDASTLDTNMFVEEGSDGAAVYEYMQSRLELPIHQILTEKSVENSFAYFFDTMRCGIYVMIKDNKLVIFCPFAKRNYTNTWKGRLRLPENMDVDEYYAIKQSQGTARPENYIPDVSKWWANGNIICSEVVSKENEKNIGVQWWGDHFLFQLQVRFIDLATYQSFNF
jgi:hypothetical protein